MGSLHAAIQHPILPDMQTAAGSRARRTRSKSCTWPLPFMPDALQISDSESDGHVLRFQPLHPPILRMAARSGTDSCSGLLLIEAGCTISAERAPGALPDCLAARISWATLCSSWKRNGVPAYILGQG